VLEIPESGHWTHAVVGFSWRISCFTHESMPPSRVLALSIAENLKALKARIRGLDAFFSSRARTPQDHRLRR
jgi:hypothetical protein